MRLRLLPFGFIVIVFVSTALLHAQAPGGISGKVTSASGTPVAFAKVSAKSVATGKTSETQTDTHGLYKFENLPAGQYEVTSTAEAVGSNTIMATVASGAAQTVDLALAPLPNGPSLSDLGFTPAQVQGNPAEQARLNRRSHMLKIHQKLGLITTIPLAATIITGFGAGGRSTSSSTRDLHVALGSTTAAMYFTTAYFAIFAPKIPNTETRGQIRWHKALAWVHGTGMILTPILGAMAFNEKSKGERIHGIASLHGPVAVITGAAYGAALLSVSIKF